MDLNLMEISDLKCYYFSSEGIVQAVDGISLEIRKGEFVGLAGESGCGKTTLAFSILKVLPYSARIVGGHIYFKGKDIVSLDEKEMREIRWKGISMIFQAALNSLNPLMRVGDQIVDVIRLHDGISKEAARERVKKIFGQLEIEPERADNYPFEFSGGMNQRAIIAMALACNPRLVIADEPTTALDVTIQAQILELLRQLKRTHEMSLLLITHDLSVIAETCDRIAIMYAGKILEYGDAKRIFVEPIHPYTRGLINAVPTIEKSVKNLLSIPGEPPSLIDPPPGCRFHPRCPYAREICRIKEPPLTIVSGRRVACFFCRLHQENIS
jgi:peptide/nickel transport system ATP-binding protein